MAQEKSILIEKLRQNAERARIVQERLSTRQNIREGVEIDGQEKSAPDVTAAGARSDQVS